VYVKGLVFFSAF